MLIVGSGWNVLADLAKFDLPCERMAVKEIGMTMFPCRHWFSCHTEDDETGGWEMVRRAMARYTPVEDHPIKHGKQGGNWLPWPIAGEWGIDSGQSAAILGCLLGYDEIWLAGMPADNGGHFWPWKVEEAHETLDGRLQHWERLHRQFFRGKVKSLSGNTREILNAAC